MYFHCATVFYMISILISKRLIYMAVQLLMTEQGKIRSKICMISSITMQMNRSYRERSTAITSISEVWGGFQCSYPEFPRSDQFGLGVESRIKHCLNYTTGVYQINNRLYNAGGGSFVIPSAGAGLQRIDAIVAEDDLTPPTGTIARVAGVDAVTPVRQR